MEARSADGLAQSAPQFLAGASGWSSDRRVSLRATDGSSRLDFCAAMTASC